MNNRNLEYDQSLKEEEMVKAERSKTGPYSASDLNRVFVERMAEQGMSKADAERYIADVDARLAAKR